MILLGIRTQAHVIDVCSHLTPAGSQFLYKGLRVRTHRIFFCSF